MSDSASGNQPTHPKETQVNEPDILDLDRIETTSGLDSINEASVKFESLTEATLKYETPKAREAREKRELAEQAHKHTVGLIKILLASALLLGFFALGVYLFAFKLFVQLLLHRRGFVQRQVQRQHVYPRLAQKS